MKKYRYVRQEDIEEYKKFCWHHVRGFGRNLPDELWHYTDGNGLIGILKSGQIWSTQVSCLNDTLEQKYFGDLVHQAIKERRAKNADPLLDPLFRIADFALDARDFTATGQFVACLSEAEDDLGQWRGYGGGESGYAIGFRTQGIIDALAQRPSAMLLPMGYTDSVHSFIVEEVMKWAEVYYRNGLSRALPEPWAREFVDAFADELSIIAALVKHPKFSGEQERRIATLLQEGEHKNLVFKQKKTLMARHLPIDLTAQTEGNHLLPITRIYVGPGPAQKVSKISIGDLLLQCGYQKWLP